MSPARQAPFIVWLAALALALTFAAGALRPAPSAAAQAAVTVTIGARLSPPTVTIPPGATVTWRNADREEHRIRSSTGPIQFDSGDLDANQAFAFTFTVAGTFDYHDDRNRSDSNYFGQVIVSSSPPPSPDTGGGGGGGGGGTAPPPPPSSASARIVDYGYEPAQLIVAVGATITWTNAGQAKHTVTATGGAFDSGILDTGGTYSRTFTAAGAFSYFCDLHPSMTASVSVAEPGKPPPPPPAAPPAPPAPPPAPGGGSGGGGPAAPGSVSALDYSFSPATFQVTPGTTVTWVNNGAAPHTVTAGDGSFDSGTMRPGAAYSRTFSAAGNYGYFCALHPGMTGSVTVTATPSNPPGGVNPGNPGSLPPNLPGGAAPPALPSAPGEVSAADYDFLPGTLTITPGSKVTWKFTGVAPHTVTANDGSFDSGILKNGSTYVRTFPTPGTFAYFCAIHPNMTGLVQVALPGTTAPPPAPGSAPRPASAATSGDVGMFDFEFAPASIAIAAGGTVTWGNRGIAPHTVTARDGSFDSGIVAAGGVFSRRSPRPEPTHTSAPSIRT